MEPLYLRCHIIFVNRVGESAMTVRRKHESGDSVDFKVICHAGCGYWLHVTGPNLPHVTVDHAYCI